MSCAASAAQADGSIVAARKIVIAAVFTGSARLAEPQYLLRA
jgi:hypothetical protein